MSPDFTKENLSMLSNLMLAQAQYLFYRLATQNQKSADILAKIAQQISEYFKIAADYSRKNSALINF
jgi:hypothetical protein